MEDSSGHALTGQALVSDQAATRLAPTGIDPSRGKPLRCECSEEGVLQSGWEGWYDAEVELPFVNHGPGECACQNDLAWYRRSDGAVVALCSCCTVFGSTRLRDSDGSGDAGETHGGSTVGDSAGPKDIAQ